MMITSAQYPQIILGMVFLGLITFSYRYSFVSRHGKKLAQKIPPKFLALLGPAVFASIITNNILSHQGDFQQFKNKILVALTSLIVAYFTKNVVVTLVFGLVLLNFIQN